jgi:CBS domain-containing protein
MAVRNIVLYSENEVAFIAEAAQVMLEHKISSLPVVDGNGKILSGSPTGLEREMWAKIIYFYPGSTVCSSRRRVATSAAAGARTGRFPRCAAVAVGWVHRPGG